MRELAATIPNSVVLPCDVTNDARQIAALTASLDAEFGGLDFVLHGAAFAPACRGTVQPPCRPHAKASALRSMSVRSR